MPFNILLINIFIMSIIHSVRHHEIKQMDDIHHILSHLDESKVTSMPAVRPQSGSLVVYKPSKLVQPFYNVYDLSIYSSLI
jgi:hypothetical protein